MTTITIDPDAEEGGANEVELVERAPGIGIGDTPSVGQTAATAGKKNELPGSRSPGNNNNSHNTGDGEQVDGDDGGISLEELIYGASSFHAVAKPVSITMILAALAVIYINTDATKAAGERALEQTYQVFAINEDHSAATSLGLGLINSLVLVICIGLMTFVLVLLYKYRCMKILIGYMILASTMLLGFLGGHMFMVAINKYQLAIDQISFYFTMYNFSIVGTVAVFYIKGIPMYINQAYLVATSVIVAWQLSYFNEWMAWALLIMLALYDLFAVLTPCGPLKALVKLMSKDDAPDMPGLLYEARLPENATRPGRKRKNDNCAFDACEPEAQHTERRADGSIKISATDQTISVPSQTDVSRGTVINTDAVTNGNVPEPRCQPRSLIMGPSSNSEEKIDASSAMARKRRPTHRNENGATSSQIDQHAQPERNLIVASTPLEESTYPTTILPLAIAQVYKLPIVSTGSLGANISLDTSSPTAYLQQQFSSTELQTDVEVKLPKNGGRIESKNNKRGEPRFTVYNRNGEVKRTLVVSEDGKVMEIIPRDDDGKKEDNTIKLGLGDFIFYSVLVSKAAQNGFASFVACFLSILTGLGGTLVLLAVYHKALPALPISIFLAVIMFVLTIYCMEPWIQDLWRAGPFYV